MPTSHAALVAYLVRSRLLRSERAINAFAAVDRGDFVADPHDAYLDAPSVIGSGATISAPHMHAMCVTELEPSLQPGARVLDVGSGSGFLLPVFSQLVSPGGLVVGVEHVPLLVSTSEDNLKKHHGALLADGRVKLIVGDGREGAPEYAPFDAIHVGAAADAVPPALLNQLKVGGRLVMPVGHYVQSLKVLTKLGEGRYAEADKADVRYVPLTDLESQTGGQATAEAGGGHSGTRPGGAPWFSGFL